MQPTCLCITDPIPIQLTMEAEVNSLAQGHLAGLDSTGQDIQALEEQIKLVCVPGKLGQRLCCRQSSSGK